MNGLLLPTQRETNANFLEKIYFILRLGRFLEEIFPRNKKPQSKIIKYITD